MRYKKGFIIMLLFVLFYIGFKVYRDYNINSMHTKINISDVESIKIYGTAIKVDRYANSDETKNIINWFNSTTDIRRNREFEGVGTPDSNILIQLKSGGRLGKINIAKSGQDFEVQKHDKKGKLISYWGKQSDIRRILKEAAGE